MKYGVLLAISVYCSVSADAVQTILSLAAHGDIIQLNANTLFANVPLPSTLATFINTLTIIPGLITQELNPADFSTKATIYARVTTITGHVTIDQSPVEIIIRVMVTSVNTTTIAVVVNIPCVHFLQQIDATLGAISDAVGSEKTSLVYASGTYHEPQWNIDINTGVSFCSVIKPNSDITVLLDGLGRKPEHLMMVGTLTPALIGSSFVADCGMGVAFKCNGIAGKTTGLRLVAAVTGFTPTPDALKISLALQTGLLIKIPGQENPLECIGAFAYTPPSNITLAGWMRPGSFYGPPAWGIPGLRLSDFCVSVDIDLTQVIASDGTLVLSGYGLSGALCYGTKKILLTSNVDTAHAHLIMVGAVEHISIEDLGLIVTELIENSDMHVQHPDLVSLLDQSMPLVEFNKVQLFVAPTDAVLFDTVYQQGITINACAHIADADIDCTIAIDQDGFKGTGSVKNLQLGPIMITGYSDGQSPLSSAALMTIECDATSRVAGFYIEGGISLDVMDGVAGNAKIKFSPTGFTAQLNSKIFGQFDASLILGAQDDLTNDSNYVLDVQLTNNACASVVTMLQNAAHHAITLHKDRDFFDAIGQLSDQAIGHVQGIVTFLQSDLIITALSFHSTVADLKAGVVPLVTISGQHGDKKFTVSTPIDFNDPSGSLVSLIKVLF